MKSKNISVIFRLVQISLFLLASICLLAENSLAAALAVGSVTGAPGTAVDVPVTFTAGTTAVSTLQFDLTFPSALSYVSVTTGSAATAAGKSASASAISGGVRVLIFGLNQTAIGSGPIATVRLNIASGTAAGALTVGITGIVASDPTGATVSTTGSGGTVTVDTTAPVISGVGASSITTTGATISWTTNEASDSQVEYGTTTSYGTSTALPTSLVTAHSAVLSGLQASTVYHYRVKSRDAAGNLATSADATFTTTAPADTTPPVISGVGASLITASGATISWTTNEPSDSQVQYGTKKSYGSSSALNSSQVTAHSVVLSGLQAGTLYHYQVKSRDAAGNLATSADATFTTTGTADTTAPVISGVAVSSITGSGATISWTTNELSDSQVDYGIHKNYSNSTVLDGTKVTAHSTTLLGLQASTLYHYRVKSRDAAGYLTTSGDATFTTTSGLSLSSALVKEQASPSSGAIFISSIVENSRFRTNLGINNLSSVDANVNVTLVDSDGMVLATTSVRVGAKGLLQMNGVARSLLTDSQGSDIQASLYLESDQPLSAWASQIENATNDPSLLMGQSVGATKILIPSAANTNSFSSSLVIMNSGTSTAQVSITCYSAAGAVLGQTPAPVSIVPSGVLSLENVLQTLGVTNNYGPIEITSLNDVPLIANSRVSSSTGMGGFFEGLQYSDASLTQIVPNVVDTAQLRTNLGINNVSDQTAAVTVHLINQDGVEMGTAPVTIAPKGLAQLNNVARQLLSQSGVSGFEGYLRLDSNQPILGWASIIDNASNDPGFSIGRQQGGTQLLLRSTANIGAFRSSLVIVNTTDATATVDIVSRDASGQVSGEYRSLAVPARGYFSSDNILQRLGVSNNFGPVEITSTNGKLIIATSRVYSTTGASGFLEGEKVQ